MLPPPPGDDPDDFSDFEGFLGSAPHQATPDAVCLRGGLNGSLATFALDGDNRLAVRVASPFHFKRFPAPVPPAVGVIEPGEAGEVAEVVGIDVVNVTASPVTLTLHFAELAPADSSRVFAICGAAVPARGAWSWRGCLPLENQKVWGQAGTANALYAYFSVRRPLDGVR